MRCFRLGVLFLLLEGLPIWAQEADQLPGDSAHSSGPAASERANNTSGFEILSKASPMQLNNYPFRVLGGVRNHWFPQLRELRNSPGWKAGNTVIEFVIERDGSPVDVRTVESAGSPELDSAAARAITAAAPFPHFPETYPGNNLRLRFHFGYDQSVGPETPLCNGPNMGAHTDVRPLTKVGNGVTPPHATNAPDPEYAETARRMKYQSRARLAGTVDPEGNFTDLCVLVPAGAGLDEKAMSAVRTWRFEPAMVDGSPVAVRINVEVDFRLY